MMSEFNQETAELASKMTDVARDGGYTPEQLLKATVVNLAAIVATSGVSVKLEDDNVTIIAKPTKETDND